jgi:hypothetical protein
VISIRFCNIKFVFNFWIDPQQEGDGDDLERSDLGYLAAPEQNYF